MQHVQQIGGIFGVEFAKEGGNRGIKNCGGVSRLPRPTGPSLVRVVLQVSLLSVWRQIRHQRRPLVRIVAQRRRRGRRGGRVFRRRRRGRSWSRESERAPIFALLSRLDLRPLDLGGLLIFALTLPLVVVVMLLLVVVVMGALLSSQTVHDLLNLWRRGGYDFNRVGFFDVFSFFLVFFDWLLLLFFFFLTFGLTFGLIAFILKDIILPVHGQICGQGGSRDFPSRRLCGRKVEVCGRIGGARLVLLLVFVRFCPLGNDFFLGGDHNRVVGRGG